MPKKLTEETLIEFLKILLSDKANYIDTRKPTYLFYGFAPLKTEAKVEAGKETENCTHSAAILTEKWDDKTVTSAPFCIVCGESASAGKEGEE